MDRDRRSANSSLSGPAFSFRGFRRSYDDSDDDDFRDANNGPDNAAAFFEANPAGAADHHHHHHRRSQRRQGDDGGDDDDDVNKGRGRDVDSDDDEAYSKGRKRRFYSCSSSSQSPYRSCQSSPSPHNSAALRDESDDDHDDEDNRRCEKNPGGGGGGEHGEGDDGQRGHHNDDVDHVNDDGDDDDSAARRRLRGRRRGFRERRRTLSTTDHEVWLFGNDNDGGAGQEDEDVYEEGWKMLPVILLEDILAMLTPKWRHQFSIVCRPWYEIFYSPRVWKTFVLHERTLTKRRFNLYKGYQRELCPRKTQLCLMRVGCFFKRIVVTPISDYYNLYEFLRVLAAYLAFFEDFPMPLLHTFRFTFACESRGVNGVAVIGTGGNILDKVKDLVSHMQHLRHLALNQLLLDVVEVPGLLAAAGKHCTESLLYLELLNCSKIPLPICEVTQFCDLVTLKLSPQHLSEEVVLLLGGTQLLRLHIVQDAYTCPCDPVPSEAWKLFKEMAPHKRVFLEIQGRTKTPLMLQPHAPVRGVVMRTPYHRLQPETTTWLIEYYGKQLEYVVQETLPRAHGSRKFSERADESFLRLVRECPKLHTLVIRERISLATLLLIAKEGARKLKSFIARKNALIKKCEWPRAQGWTEEFHGWLRMNGRDYARAFQQMPAVLDRKWAPTVDKSFKYIQMDIT